MQAVLSARVSSGRVDSALHCLMGECGVHAPKLMCVKGCGRGVHASCVGVAAAHADLGQLTCAECRAVLMAGGATPPPELVRSATKSMLWEISVGEHSTAKGYADYQRLEREWVASVGGNAVLPRDSEDSFVAMLIWLATDSGRARSFETVFRAAAGVCARTRERSMTKSDRVKRIHADVAKSLGELGVPCTQATRVLLSLMLGTRAGGPRATLDERSLRSRGGELILARSRMMTAGEGLGGMRVGEMTGDRHGIAANDMALLTPQTDRHADLGVTVEALVRDSKTGPGRYVNFVGTSRVSKVPAEQYVRDLWRAYGLDMAEAMVDGGFKVEKPDYSVVRIELLGMPLALVEALRAALETEAKRKTASSVAMHARASLYYLKLRTSAKNIAESSRYVNIAGGAVEGEAVRSARAWAGARGLSEWTSRVDGPLLRSTMPGSGALTHMPLQVGSTYTHHVGALKAAYELSKSLGDVDLELELQGQSEPHFANHSMRRFADRVARETRGETGASVMEIDIVFGWNEAQRRKDMQLHYAGLDRAQRVGFARVTMCI